MTFETAWKIMEAASAECVEIHWFARTEEYGNYDSKTRWNCRIEELPFFVSLFEVNQVDVTDYSASLFVFLEPEQTAQYWERIKRLA